MYECTYVCMSISMTKTTHDNDHDNYDDDGNDADYNVNGDHCNHGNDKVLEHNIYTSSLFSVLDKTKTTKNNNKNLSTQPPCEFEVHV